MKIIRKLSDIKGLFSYPVLTLGNFDGVHLGHRAIFRKMVKRARETQGTSIVFTFKNHTLKVLAPDKAPPQLTTFEKKMELIEKYGIDVAICIDFTMEIANLSPREFIKDIIMDKIGVRELIVGYDCAFGKGGKGSIDYLQKMEAAFGYKLDVVGPVRNNGYIISSTLIRNFVQKGEVEKSIDLLGRSYSLQGKVIDVARTGKSTDHLIANINSNEELILPVGIYLGTVKNNNLINTGFIYVKYKPAFNGNGASFKIHLSNFGGKLYAGENISINFVQRIPDSALYNLKFSNLADNHTILKGCFGMLTN